MTLPYERSLSVIRTREFLLKLCSLRSPKISRELREEARSLLKHFPSRLDFEVLDEMLKKNTGCSNDSCTTCSNCRKNEEFPFSMNFLGEEL